MRIETTTDFNQLESQPNFLRRLYERLAKAINGRISFGDGIASDNIEGVWITVVTAGVADTDFTINHNLGRPAAGYILMKRFTSVNVYESPTVNPNLNSQLILRASVPSTSVTLFVI
jgi:hypothetical protein